MKGVDGTNIQESNKTVNESVKSQFSSVLFSVNDKSSNKPKISFGVAVIENKFFNSMGKSNFAFGTPGNNERKPVCCTGETKFTFSAPINEEKISASITEKSNFSFCQCRVEITK